MRCLVLESNTVRRKFSRLKVLLLRKYPFYGAIVSGFSPVPSADAHRMFLDGNNLMINAEWFINAEMDECALEIFRISVEISLLQQSRIRSRDPVIWSLSMEAVSTAVIYGNMDPGKVRLEGFSEIAAGMSVDEFYSYLSREIKHAGKIHDVYTAGRKLKNGTSLNAEEADAIRDLMRIAGVRTSGISWFLDRFRDAENSRYLFRAKYTGKILSGFRVQAVMGSKGREDHKILGEFFSFPSWIYTLSSRIEGNTSSLSYSRIRRKYMDSDIILPSLRRNISRVNVAIDSSASIDDETLSLFISSVIQMIRGNFGFQPVRLFQVDAGIRHQIDIEDGAIPDDIYIRRGRGGTDFSDLFLFLKERGNTEPLIVLTDGNARIPEREPQEFQTYWITTGRVLPWGESIAWN